MSEASVKDAVELPEKPVAAGPPAHKKEHDALKTVLEKLTTYTSRPDQSRAQQAVIKPGETGRGEFPTVSLSITIKPSGQVIKDDFALISEPKRPTGMDKPLSFLTTNPDLLIAVADRGPLALEDALKKGREGKMTIIYRSALGERLHTLGIDSNGTMTQTQSWIEALPPGGDPKTASVVSEKINQDVLQYMLDADAFRESPLYKILSRVQEAYKKLGFSVDEEGSSRLPAPHTFLQRLAAARDEDKKSGIYYPQVAVLEQGEIDSPSYLSVFADGKYPIGAKSFDSYLHDVVGEHFASVLVYGEPLINIMSAFAQSVSEVEEVSFSPNYRQTQEHGFKGKEKLDRAADLLDSLTNHLNRIALQTVTENMLKTRGYHSPGAELEKIFNDIAGIVRKAGRLDQLAIVKDMLSEGKVKHADEITGKMMADALISSRRKQFISEEELSKKRKTLGEV